MLTYYLRAIGAYIVALTLGSLCGFVFWSLFCLGLIRVRGYKRVWLEMSQGNHAILGNHPTLKDPFLLASMWWPFGIIPGMIKKFFPWSTPAKTYFPKWYPEWAYPLLHNIPIVRPSEMEGMDDRAKKTYKQTLLKSLRWVFQTGRNIVIHPEEGRTLSPPRDPNAPPREFEYSRDGTRMMRKLLKPAVLRLAIKNKARITPVWIEIPNWKEVQKFQFWGFSRLTIHFGETYTPDSSLTDDELLRDLSRRIFEA